MASEPVQHHDHLFRVLYRDTDQMGVVYYANYYAFMEMGRVELMRAKGIPYSTLESEGILIPVVHSHCDYKKPARYDDQLRIRTRISEITRIRLRFAYEIYLHATGELLATGETHHVFMGRDHRPLRVSSALVERLSGPVLVDQVAQ